MVDIRVDNNSIGLRARVEGEGPDLMLVHGVGSNLDSWNGVAAALDGRFRTIRLDLRGHGESDKPAGRYELDNFVSDVLAVRNHLDIERCHLAGHSLGGLVAQGFALGHPDRLDRLMLLSTAAGRTDEERARVEARLTAGSKGLPGEHFEKSLERWFTPAFIQDNPDAIAHYAGQNKKNDPAAYASAYRVLAQTDLADRLSDITAPTLVATGDSDIGSNPRMALLMHERIAGSSLHILGTLRHSILAEAPERVAALIGAFLV
ncbi:MAG: alpha/beta fold hydrolase [Rhodospirillales bacterium]|nr:alpha/beta fold hydrolase [Rhodospirillales bacterium]